MALNSSCCLICFSSSSFLYKALSLRYSSSPPLPQASANRFQSSNTGLSSMYFKEGILVMRVLRQWETFLLKPLFCKYTTDRLGIFWSIYGMNYQVSTRLSEMSRAEMLGHQSKPIRSGRPSAPIRFRLIWKVDRFLKVAKPETFSIILSLRLRLTKLTSISIPPISLIRFSCKYKHLNISNFSKFSIFLIALPSKYTTLSPVNSSKLSIFSNPLQCRQRMSLRAGVEQYCLKSERHNFFRNYLLMTPLSQGLGFRCMGE